jgi:hypothetical protein
MSFRSTMAALAVFALSWRADAMLAPGLRGAAPAATPFRCTLVLGVAVTSEWFDAGFEKVLDDARWEAITKPHTTLAEWADPANVVWSLAPVSPCGDGPADPDRVLFTGMNWDYTTAEQWVASLSSVVGTIRSRYPHAREIDLLTMIRAPGNVSCGNAMSVVQPFIDQAVQAVAARFPGLAVAGPRFEAPSCAAFKKGGPHFTTEGAAAVAKVVAAYYARE